MQQYSGRDAGTGLAPFEGSLAQLRHQIDDLVDGLGGGHRDIDEREIIAQLETAHEELRVAEEEVRTQHEQISRLLDEQDIAQWQHERMLSLLPVPVAITDMAGVIRSVNAAAAGLFGMRVGRLVGKPVLALFDNTDRAELRILLAAQRVEPVGFHAAPRVERTGKRVELSVTAAVGDQHRLSWMMLAAQAGDERSNSALPASLALLTALPGRVADLGELLTEAAYACLAALGEGAEVSLATGSPLQPQAVATTSKLAQAMDGAQSVVGEGPCVTAFDEREAVRSVDVAADPRWPRLSPHVPAEIGGAIAVPLEVGENLAGALNVYWRDRTPSSRQLEAAELLGTTVASVLYELGLRSQLQDMALDMERALASRAVIDQAKGIIMRDRGWDAERAFSHLVELSGNSGVKVRDVARQIVGRFLPAAPEA